MANSHPMEAIFVREIEKIVATIFRQELNKDEQLKKLQAHLEKAKKSGWLRYRAEVLNAISLVYFVYPDGDEVIAMEKLQEALIYAEQTDDLDLKLKLISNISEAEFEYAFDTSQAEATTDRGLKMQAQSYADPVMSVLFLKLNKIRYQLWRADFSSAEQMLSEVHAEMDSYVFNSAQRNDYGRGIFFARDHQIKLHFYNQSCKEAQTTIKINRELFKDINKIDADTFYYINQALYALICNQNHAEHKQWRDKITGSTPDFYFMNFLEVVIFLKHLDYSAEALDFLDIALTIFPQPSSDILPERHAFLEDLRAELIASS